MTQPPVRLSKLVFVLVSLYCFNACKNSLEDIPLPVGQSRFPQPAKQAIRFTETKKLDWPEKGTPVKPVIKPFDLEKLPVISSGNPDIVNFSKPPDIVPLNLDAIPDSAFDFDKLISRPIKYLFSVLPAPKIIKAGLPVIRQNVKSIIYELPDAQALLGITHGGILNDKSGFLWFSTEKGIYRYDGDNFYLYLEPSEKSYVPCMVEDRSGQIWIGTIGNGIYVINPKTSIVKHLIFSRGLSFENVWSFVCDKENRIWAFSGSKTGDKAELIIIDEKSTSIRSFGIWQVDPGKTYLATIAADADNCIWVPSFKTGVMMINTEKGTIKTLDKSHGISSEFISCILKDQKNRMLIGSVDGNLDIFDPGKKIISRYTHEQGLKLSCINSLNSDAAGNIWLGTVETVFYDAVGLEMLNPGKGFIRFYTKENGLVKSVADQFGNNITNMLLDNRGQVWVTNNSGFQLLRRNNLSVEHEGDMEVASLAADNKNNTWTVTTHLGIQIRDERTGTSLSFSSGEGLASSEMWDITAEGDKLLIKSGKGMDIVNPSGKQLEHFGRTEGLSTDTVNRVIIDKKGMMWISVGETPDFGVDLYDPINKSVKHLGSKQGLKKAQIYDMVEDRNGNIWLDQGLQGIGIIDPVEKTVRFSDSLSVLTNSYTNLLLADESGNIWIGTSNGIFVINSGRDSVTSITNREGILNDRIQSLHEFEGRIYAGTASGLSIISPPSSKVNDWKIESFGKSQGITKNLSNTNTDAMTKDGGFLWGDKGITKFNYRIDSSLSPSTYISGVDILNQRRIFKENPWLVLDEKDTLHSSSKDTFYLKGQSVNDAASKLIANLHWDSLAGPFNMPVNLQLPYNQNSMLFHFGRVHLGSEDSAFYRFILLGADKQWSDGSATPESTNYTNLQPGDYIFKVTSRGPNDKWSVPDELKFTILPPWYKTVWAYLLYLVVIGTALRYYIRFRSRRLMQENQELETKIAQRTGELKQSLDELKETQVQLVQREKMASLGELTAGIAHEIQNPLNFVNNFSELSIELAKELQDELAKLNIAQQEKNTISSLADDLVQNQEKINHHGKRADAIVKGMLQHSRVNTGQKEPTDINALTDEYLKLSYHGLRARDKNFNVTLETQFDPQAGTINLVPQEIGRVLLNMFTNSFYAVSEKKMNTDPGIQYQPKVVVSTLRAAGTLEIRIRDNGTGIPPKILDKIYQPFFTTKPSGTGTGLGLSLSYDIVVNMHGGQILVDTREGEFTEFIIRLPLNEK